jgi:hypothetical protein
MVTVSSTRSPASQNATSMGKRMPKVCTDIAGRSSIAPSIPSRPSSPRERLCSVAATSSGASTSPSRSSHAIG